LGWKTQDNKIESLDGAAGFLRARANRHAWFGLLLALATLIIATLLAALVDDGDITITGLLDAQQNNPALWFLDLMPLLFLIWGQYVGTVMSYQASAMVLDETRALREQTSLLEYRLGQAATPGQQLALPNRHGFEAELNKAISRRRLRGGACAVLVISAEQFREVELSQGEQMAQELIEQLAQRLQNVLGAEEFLAHLGDDDFAVLQPRVADEGEPQRLAARIQLALDTPLTIARRATSLRLCIYDHPEDGQPSFEHHLDPRQNRTGDIWHVHVDGVGPGALYAWRADGPFMPERGFRFNPNKILLDPYAKALTGDFIWSVDAARAYDVHDPRADLSFSRIDDAAQMPKCIVIDDDEFDWQGDRPLNLPLRHCVIYETHVRGFTAGKGSGVSVPGSYQGLIEKIPYLKELGVTSLELLPIQEFDEFENPRLSPTSGKPLAQYWGYSTLAFFAPKGLYSSSGAMGQQVTEFKTMVRELHTAGIEVILDVVFNHTGEGNELGPTVSFRGLDNSIWYMLDEDPRRYKNYSGCGNTLNCNHPVVRSFIVDCLHYWVVDMHVDGFRFDLGSILDLLHLVDETFF